MQDGSELHDERFRLGDREAADQVFSRLRPLVRAIARQELRDPLDVEDMTQEVFRRALSAADSLEDSSKIRPWIISITRNCISDFRKKRVTPVHDTAPQQTADSGESPEGAALARERRNRVRAVIHSLPEIYRVPLALRVLHEHSYREISEILQLPLSSVKNRVARGGRLLIEKLRTEGDLFGEENS